MGQACQAAGAGLLSMWCAGVAARQGQCYDHRLIKAP